MSSINFETNETYLSQFSRPIDFFAQNMFTWRNRCAYIDMMDSDMDLSTATTIIDKALAHARAQNYAPMTITVLDSGGHVVATKREDGSAIMRPQIAHAKAWGVLGTGSGGRALAKRGANNPVFFSALSAISEGKILPALGGIIIRDADGKLLGSLGISGDMPERDEECALTAIAAIGLTAEP
jgi:uncharacterized protein GlcG (DUF336 family)